MPQASRWLFPLFSDHDTYDRTMRGFSDLHLYTGSKCNRQCAFCIVSGRPDGWYKPLTAETLDAALALVPLDATIKFYGGEPTIDTDNMLWAMRYMRERNFTGWFTIFTNGILADRIVRVLEADDKTDVVLNYSILHGEDAEPIPDKALALLCDYARAHPNRIYSSHAGVFPFGRGADFVADAGRDHVVARMHTSFDKKIEAGQVDPAIRDRLAARDFRLCPRCRPAVGTDGRHHACPFAIESTMPHFDLGSTDEPAAIIHERFQRFLDWIDRVLEPEAERLQAHPCSVCTHKLHTLPTYEGAPRRASDTTACGGGD